MTHPRLDSIAVKLAIVLVAWCAAAVAQNKKTTAIPPQPPPTATTPGTQPGNANRGMLGASESGGMLAKPSLLGNDVEHMTQAQFRALADTAMLRYRGQSLTKANFMQQRLKEFQMQARSIQPKAGVSFEILKAQFEQKQAAELAKENAQAQAVIDALNNRTKQIESSASYLALAKEAAELQRRYSSSNSTQKAQLKQRALEIHNQLLEIELGKK